jgi:hypothetical protein
MADLEIVGTAVGSGDASSFVDGLRARGIAAADLATVDALALVAEVLYEYSRFRPVMAVLVFETIADQQEYSWSEMGDADGRSAVLVMWNPYQVGDEWTAARVLATLGIPRDAGYYHLPSQELVEQIKASAFAANYGGSGYQHSPNGGSVYLTPTPEQAGDEVFVLYTKGYASVSEIVAADRDIFLDLVESVAADRTANEVAKKSAASRIRTPEYEREVGAQIRYWRDRSQTLRDRFESKCNAGMAAVARS